MKLSDWLSTQNLSASDLATHLSVTRQTVYGWLSGDFGPSRRHMLTIIQITNGEVNLTDFEPVVPIRVCQPALDALAQVE